MASPVTAAAMRHPSHDRKALVAMLGWLRAQWIEQGSPAYMADLSGELIYANDAMEALLDLPLEYWHGDHPLSVRAFIAGDVVSELGRGTGPFTCRLRITTTGGATDFRSAHRFLSDPDGKPACIAGQFELTDDRPLVRQAVERFDDIGRLVADWIWETDRTFTITYVTNRVTQALGLLPVELQGRKLFDLGAFEDSADRKLASDLMNGSRMPFRDRYFVMPTKSGPCRTCRLSGLPVFDTRDGSFSGYRGTALDVSDALAAETRARSAQQRLEDAVETIGAGFLVVDPDGRVVLANHQMGTLYPQ
ncbi:MAG: PAS domain-containing protein, partial [Alphaproteobacteria bacterium]